MALLTKYTPGRDADLLVAQWWATMDADGDLDRLYGNAQLGLSDLFVALRSPRELLYAADDAGIWFTVGFEPMMAGAYLSAYIRPDRRRTVAAGSLFLRCLRAGVTAYGTLLNVTWQEELIPIHEAMGYTFVGRVPRLFNGREALIFAVSTDSLERRHGWHSSSQPSAKRRQPQVAQAPQPVLDFKELRPDQPSLLHLRPTPQVPLAQAELPALVPAVLRVLQSAH